MAKDTMKAVIFKEPHKVAVEDRPIPKLKESTDIIVKVIYSALCGSELHVFRVSTAISQLRPENADRHQGHQPSPTGFIMVCFLPEYSYLRIWDFDIEKGHEFTGIVEETGSAVKNFKKGDQIVSPFTVSWSAG